MEERPDLRTLFGPYVTPGLEVPNFFRFHDAPPAVVRAALAVVDPFFRTSRPNGQPPAEWLVEMASRFGGTLSGSVGTDDELPVRLRVDAVCVPGEHGSDLARSVARDWPEPEFGEEVLALALAEGWRTWDAQEASWTGNGRDLIDASAPAPVIGLWWD
ncbi:MAG: hypothetical protein JJD92_09400 [Frankiaceae bacterium]|nr:hypothetical protein [Frankiaceae bacterium]